MTGVCAASMWKVGDWCLWEFELALIEEVTDGRVTGISTGYIWSGSHDHSDRCVPLTKRNLQISQGYDAQSHRLHREGSNALNYPAIKDWMVREWRQAIETTDDHDLKPRYDLLRAFVNEMLEAGREENQYGFSTFRPRL